MKKATLLACTLFMCLCAYTQDFTTVFEKSKGTETATYPQVIEYYQNLAKKYKTINIKEVGNTDAGYPLHMVTYNPNKEFNFDKIHKTKRVLLINNGIHPGESDGIDATMMLYRDYASGKLKAPKNTVLVTIPVYNVGGSLNRNSHTRTNQNGPKEYGFRGNARNFDLNRDFIKSDTKNARAFAVIFHEVNPDVFIDNHVSNGADYQYILTHLFTQHNKLGGKLGEYLNNKMTPGLEKGLAAKKWDITPYVNVFNSTPDKGFSQFYDSPRYSTGYTTLFNTLGMMVETHMLKPYKQRVEGTYVLMETMVEFIEEEAKAIKTLRDNAFAEYKPGKTYPLQWTIDTTRTSKLQFKGYEGEYPVSEVTGIKRLKYNREKPFTKEVTYRNYFKPRLETTIPNAYIIPQGWHNAIDLLKLNNVKMRRFTQDTTINVESYRILDLRTSRRSFENHYMHSGIKLDKKDTQVTFKKGDYYVPTNQKSVRYILETLEPQATDSFFKWNFFDTILGQKEGFSPYVFEDEAKVMLDNDPKLKAEFEAKKKSDENFAKSWYGQLSWLHKRSKNYEPSHMQYPVYRVK